MSKLVLVTGATGALGPAIVDELLRAGYRVRAHGREARPELFPGEVEAVRGELTNAADARRIVAGTDAVVHLAAMLHVNNPARELVSEYRQVNVQGTQNVLDAAVAEGLQRFVYISTIAVYGNDRSEVLTEQTDPRPSTAYAITKLEGEKRVLAARVGPDRAPFAVVLRLAAVYGSRVKGNYRALLEQIARGRFLPIGRGRNRRTLVHERDVARAAVIALSDPACCGHVYNVTDGSYHTVEEIIAAISSALGKRAPRVTLPLKPVRIAAKALDHFLRIAGRPTRFSSAVQKYTENVVVSSDAIRRDLGFVPEFDLVAGWREVVTRIDASDL